MRKLLLSYCDHFKGTLVIRHRHRHRRTCLRHASTNSGMMQDICNIKVFVSQRKQRQIINTGCQVVSEPYRQYIFSFSIYAQKVNKDVLWRSLWCGRCWCVRGQRKRSTCTGEYFVKNPKTRHVKATLNVWQGDVLACLVCQQVLMWRSTTSYM